MNRAPDQVRKVGWGSKSCSTFDWLRGPQNARNMTAADGCANTKKYNNAMHPLLRAVSLSSALPRFLQFIVRKGFPLTRGLRGLVESTFSRVRDPGSSRMHYESNERTTQEKVSMRLMLAYITVLMMATSR